MNTDLVYYVSGPMTGLPEYNYPTFEYATTRLRKLGLQVLSPHEIPPPSEKLQENLLWEYYMRKCQKQMEVCQALVQLPGWPQSRGALQELQWAIDHRYKAFYFMRKNGILVQLHL